VAPPAGPEIWVTGLAWTTPLGDTLDGVWGRLLAGDTGLHPTPSAHPLRTDRAGVVPGVPLDWAPSRRQHAITVPTLAAAFGSAGLDPADPAVRLVLGTSFGSGLDEPTAYLGAWADAAAASIGHPHPPVSVSTACSAGADGIAVAVELIRAGTTEICVAGGADVVTPAKRLGHSALGTMSRDTLRAFDRRHDGMVPGEGAAFLVLETAGSARRRGAAPRAILRGTGAANDATGLTAPDPTGDSVVLAVDRCLAGSGYGAADVAVVNAHGTATPLNDAVEETSLGRMFGGRDTPPVVFATKGALGHSLGATGAIEAVAVVLALRDRKVPPIVGLDEPTAGFPLPLAIGGPAALCPGVGLSLTLGFGGFNTCLLFEGVDDAA